MKNQEIDLRFFKNVEVESPEGLVAFLESNEAQDFLSSCPDGVFKVWGWKAHDSEPSLRAIIRVTDHVLKF